MSTHPAPTAGEEGEGKLWNLPPYPSFLLPLPLRVNKRWERGEQLMGTIHRKGARNTCQEQDPPPNMEAGRREGFIYMNGALCRTAGI